MNIYDILRQLVEGVSFNGYNRESALQVIDELRNTNALGTVSGRTSEGTHECSAGPEGLCTVCNERMTPPIVYRQNVR